MGCSSANFTFFFMYLGCSSSWPVYCWRPLCKTGFKISDYENRTRCYIVYICPAHRSSFSEWCYTRRSKEKSLLKWFVCSLWLVPAVTDTVRWGGVRSQRNHIKSCWSLGMRQRGEGGGGLGCTKQHSARTLYFHLKNREEISRKSRYLLTANKSLLLFLLHKRVTGATWSVRRYKFYCTLSSSWHSCFVLVVSWFEPRK